MTTTHEGLLERLRALLGAAHVLEDAADTAPYLTDWRGRYHGRALAVVRPATTDEVAGVVRACRSAGVAIVPQGGNTGLCGGATPLVSGDSVLLSMARMNRVLEVDADNNTMLVEAGCTLDAVRSAASATGRLFPLALASGGSCEIGGNVSTNAGGVQVLRYGTMRELVLGLEVVLPDGRVWSGLRALRKDNTGYDLKQLFIGAEGTLGIVTRVVLKLFSAPAASVTAWAVVADVQAAVRLLRDVQRRLGERVSAFELVGREALQLVLQHIPDTCAPLPVSDWAVLIEVVDGGDEAVLRHALEDALAEQSAAGSVSDAVVARDGAQARALWRLRENIAEAQRIEGLSVKHDISLPVSRIPEFMTRAGALLRARWPEVRGVVFGHVGDGNLHYNVSLRDAQRNRDFIEASDEVNREVYRVVTEFDGSISAEHGLGQLKRETIREYRPPLEIELMRMIKKGFDPDGLMNPGKLV